MELSKRIALRMKALQLTQRQLSEKTGLTQAAISKYIRGKAKPGYEAISELAKALQVDFAWFFQKSESSKLPSQRMTPKIPKSVSGDIVVFPKSGKIRRDTTFKIGHYLPMQQLPPPSQAHYTGIANHFYMLIFNSLAERLPAGQPRGALAIDWKPIANSWMFRLRSGVRFHDGKPFTAEDVRWSYDQYLKRNPHERRIQEVQIVDENVVQIHLKSSCQLDDLVMPLIMPVGMAESPDQWIGTGPFQAAEIKLGFWRLKSNPYYFFGQPYLNEIHIQEYCDPHALKEALVSGEVHFAIGVDYDAENFVLKPEADAQRYHLHFLLREPLVQNPLLRRAIALGLDREALAKAAGFKRPLFSSGPFDYILGDRLPRSPQPPDLQLVRQLLKGIENLKDSVFRVQYYAPRYRPIAEAIVKQLNRIGIPTQTGEPAHALLVTRSAQTFEQEYRIWATTSPPDYNPGYSNPKVDELIQRCINESATTDRLHQLRRLIQQDLPDIPLFYDEMPVTYVKQLRALENRVVLLSSLSEIYTWYLDSDLVGEGKEKVSATT